MKDAKFVLEFTTHVLANGIGPDGERDHFQRDSENNLIWQQSWWYSAFTRSIELAHIRGIKAADINMNLAVSTKTEMYRRRYGEGKFRTHEAIMPGTRVEFEAIVADRVTESVLDTILERMGKYVGLSPYGYKLGYGKFNVISVDVAPSEDSETSVILPPETEEPDDEQSS
jgi:hypothetical protein